MCVIRRHFLACEDILVGPTCQRGECFFHEIRWPVRWVPAVRGETFFREIQRPFRWVPAVRWRNHYFARTVHGRWMSFVDHVDKAAPRAPGRWTTARPRKGTTQSRGRLGNGCPRGGEYEGLLVRLPSPENNNRCG